ncbi:voltage-dependent calcium channel gamma-like subunit [Polymixia lowei]
MTAISIKVQGGSPSQGKPRTHFLEVLVRSLIILCTALAIVLSSVAVCDGQWLQTAEGHMFGLWRFCTTEAVVGQNDQKRPASAHCTTQLGQSGVAGVELGLGLCRSVASLAVVAAIFGLELQVVSQVSEGQDAARRWYLGSGLVLAAAAMSASGVAVFVALLRGFASPTGFTLTFWCQFTAVFLFFLNGRAARHIHHVNMDLPALPSTNSGKY